MSKTYGVGIIGAGNISTAYIKLAPLFRNLEVRAVADIVPAAAQHRASEFGLKAQTPDELLKNSEIDVVVNLTIPATHYSVSKDIVSAGKHAYSEKPFVLSVDDGKALKRMADERGLKVGSAPDTFLGGVHQQARALIDDGRIGRIASGTCFVMGPGMENWHPNPEFFFQPGGGPILDMGPYYVTNLISLIGPVRRVTAFTGSAKAERIVGTEGSPVKGSRIKVNTPTTIHAVLEFLNGAIITLGASWDVASHGHSNMELYGTEGSLYVPDPNIFSGDLSIANATGKKEAVTPWAHPFNHPNWRHGDNPVSANYRSAGLADMMASIETGRQARCSIDVALHAVDVLTSILKSGETGQAVMLSTTCDRPASLGIDEARAMLKA